MIFGDTVNDDYLVRNPNDFRNQPEPNILLDNLRFDLPTAIATGAQNIQTFLSNATQNLKMTLENYKQNPDEYNNQYGNEIEPLFKLNLNPPVTQNNIIHEEFAEKEKRIRHLESIQIENTNEISQLKAEKLKDRKKIQHLGKEIEKLKKNPFLKWWERATEDSKKERVF